jgi:hypothetical protein
MCNSILSNEHISNHFAYKALVFNLRLVIVGTFFLNKRYLFKLLFSSAFHLLLDFRVTIKKFLSNALILIFLQIVKRNIIVLIYAQLRRVTVTERCEIRMSFRNGLNSSVNISGNIPPFEMINSLVFHSYRLQVF